MAFIQEDIFDPKALGNTGQTVLGSQIHLFYTEDADITNYKLTDTASTWKKIHMRDSFTASDKTNLIEVYDNGDLVESLNGKTSSEVKITQMFRGFLNSIGKLKGKKIWLAEAYSDTRDPKETDGTVKIFEYRLVNATLPGLEEEKSDAEALSKITLTGNYNVATQKRIFRNITPAGGVVLTPTGGTSGTAGTPKSMVVTSSDFVGNSIDISDLTASTLMEEITAINIIKVSGIPTISVSAGANDATKSVTFTGTGSCVIAATITTSNGGTWTSPSVTMTIS